MQKAIRLVTRFLAKCQKDKINAYSAQIAFFIILSIIPFLMVFSSMLQYTSITEDMVFEIIERVMPQYVAPFLVTLVKEIYTRSMGIISVTAIIAIWSAAKGIQYMADGLNAVHELKETRNWFVLRFWAVIYTIVFLVAIVFTLVVLVFGNSLRHLAADYLPFIAHLVKIIIKFRGLILLLLLILFFGVNHCIRKCLYFFFRSGNQIIRQTLGRFHADSRQLCKLFCQQHHGQCIAVCHGLKQTRQGYATCNLAHFGFCCAFYLVYSFVDGTNDQILQHFYIFRINDFLVDSQGLDDLLSSYNNGNCTAARGCRKFSVFDVFL